MPTRLRTLLVMLAALAAAACSESTDEPPPPDLTAYLADNFGLHVWGYVEVLEQVQEEDHVVTRVRGFTRIEDGPYREMSVRQEQFAAAAGGDLILVITDVATDVARFFLYNFDGRYIVFGEDLNETDSRGTGVQLNPDGTYEVWSFDDTISDRTNVETVPDGYTAMRHIEAFNGFADIDPHIMLTGFALGHSPVPESRVPTPQLSSGTPPETASSAAVCTIFKAFCDCVACRTLGRGGDCALCPEL